LAKRIGKPQSRPDRKPKSAAEGDGFWDRPPLMNMVADLLLLFAGSGLIYAALIFTQRLPIFHLDQVVVAGPLEQVTQMQIEHAAKSSLAGNFFTVNLDTVRTTFEKLPWVRRVAVRRLWPDGIEVAIEEHVAAARWRQADGESRLVDTHGEVFAASTERDDLPSLAGPADSAARMLERQRDFEKVLAPVGRKAQALLLTAREAWQVRLDDGLVLELGRDQEQSPLAERLNRFVATYQQAQGRLGRDIALIDMRYPNGFALRPARAGNHKA
jgi:cell division protein FtsQ